MLTEEEIRLFMRKGAVITQAIRQYQRELNLNYQEKPKQKKLGTKPVLKGEKNV